MNHRQISEAKERLYLYILHVAYAWWYTKCHFPGRNNFGTISFSTANEQLMLILGVAERLTI